MSTPTQTIVGSEQAPTVDDVEKSTLLNGEDGGGDEAVLGMEGSVGEGLGSTSVVQDGDSNPISKVIVGEASEGKTEKLDVNSNLIELGNLENSGGDKVAEFSELNEEIKQTKLKDDVVEEDINTELLNAESSIIASGPKDVTDAGDTKLNSDEAVEDKKAEDEVDENAILHNEADQAEDEADAKAILCNGSDQTIAADEGGDKVAEYLELAEETKESKMKDEVVGEDNKAELLNAESSIIASGPKDVTDARDAKLNSDEVVEDKKTEDEADENATLNNGSDQTTAANEAGDKVAEYSELNEETIEIKLKDEVVDEDKKIELLNAESSVIASGPKDVTDAGDTKLNSDEAVEDKKTEDEVDETATLNNGSDQTEDEADAKAILCNGSDQTTGADLKVIGSDADSEKVLADNVEPTEEEPVGEEIASAEEPSSFLSREVMLDAEDKAESDTDGEGGSVSDDDDTDGLIFGSSEASKRFIEEFGIGSGGDSQSGAGSSRDDSQRIDGQIVTDSDEEADTDEDGDGKELFDSAALTALLKAATSAGSENGSITISAQDASRLFSVERPAGLGSSLQSLKPASRTNRSSLFTPGITTAGESENNLSEEDKKKLEKLQSIRVKFLRLVHRLGLSVEESVAAQVLYRLALIAGRQTGQLFSLDDAKTTAMQLEAEGKDDLDFSVNILVLGKSGVGKSATINSIFGEEKAQINAFEPATNTVKEISGLVDGVKIRVFDTPGLRSSAMEQSFNRSVLSSVKKLTKKNQPDIVYYVDRLDAQTRDLNDLPLLRMITSTLGPSILRSAIVTLTHAASAPPEGPNGSPLSYEGFVTQRSHVVQQSIGQAVGDLRMMSPSLMNPVTLVENHPSCRKNREGQKVLPNGQSWRPQLLLLSYSMKILAEANSVSKPQDPFDHRKLFGFRVRSPPLPYMLSSMLQSRQHPKLSTEQGGDDSDADLADISDSSDQEDEDEYDQLPPFKPLKKAQLANLSKEQQKAYFEEYDYRVKLQQKKQWKEEVKRMREMKKGGNNSAIDGGFMEDDGDTGAAAPVAVPLPDMVLPPSFDSDNSAYRYRFLEPTSQFLARPVLDTHGWDHDCGYDGVNVEQSLAIASRFPAVVAVQVTKDKKEFNFNLDSSIAAKHGDNGSTMAGFDIQPIGKQLAYIVRGETKFKNLKKNKTAAGFTVTFLGENVATGFKVEDQIVLGKQYVFVGSAGTVRSQQDAAYGANIEVQRRELGYPIGQVQSSFGLSIIKWRGDLALGFNSLAQFSVGRGSKVAVRAGINNKLSGQITVKTSSSEHLSLVLAGFVPTVIAIYKKIWPGVNDKYSIY